MRFGWFNGTFCKSLLYNSVFLKAKEYFIFALREYVLNINIFLSYDIHFTTKQYLKYIVIYVTVVNKAERVLEASIKSSVFKQTIANKQTNKKLNTNSE